MAWSLKDAIDGPPDPRVVVNLGLGEELVDHGEQFRALGTTAKMIE